MSKFLHPLNNEEIIDVEDDEQESRDSTTASTDFAGVASRVAFELKEVKFFVQNGGDISKYRMMNGRSCAVA
ncbi:uncharacterized protein N7498_007358 [Penicillium cinerascens]|uniref:Uncharacterized protein n=1 Tax=Penicillium cinerascens TaxID=70096 RepID=A0A9W9JQ53_9EURO|nr:uncharacterized protein N7498_007358 [Penicillium cinerascens]KAJ5198241.1 hypothetical protein N7498_007358 [Penicillium cinerascens]